MMYSDLKAGEYSTITLDDTELWSAFAYFFSSNSSMNTSYKYAFFKSILDNLYNVDEDLVLTYDQLFYTFVKIYWNLINVYKLRQQIRSKKSSNIEDDSSNHKSSLIEKIINKIFSEFKLETVIPFDSIPSDAKLSATILASSQCSKYVVGSLFGDTKEYLYSFRAKNKTEQGYIRLNPNAYKFLCRNKIILEKVNYYEWAKFLEKANNDDHLDKILTKLDESTIRQNLSYYRNILYNEFEQNCCFYCGKSLKNLSSSRIAVDHFIPWSFIKDDKIWNFVLACQSCNSSKSDKLPTSSFLTRITERNANFISNSNKFVNENEVIKDEFKIYHIDLLTRIYEHALSNGFNNIWAPKKI